MKKKYFCIKNEIDRKMVREDTNHGGGTQAANAKGLTVEWLVSDQTAVNQLTSFFAEKNVNIVVKYLAE